MSSTEIYAVGENYCSFIGETKNAWRGAMYVWDDIARRYFNLECFPSFGNDDIKKIIWNAGNEHDLTEHELIVLASTMDRVVFSYKDLDRLTDAFDKYYEEHKNSSIGDQSKIIKRCDLTSDKKIAWNQTSINEFQFSPDYYEDENGEEIIIYNDLSGAWDLFEQLDSIRNKE